MHPDGKRKGKEQAATRKPSPPSGYYLAIAPVCLEYSTICRKCQPPFLIFGVLLCFNSGFCACCCFLCLKISGRVWSSTRPESRTGRKRTAAKGGLRASGGNLGAGFLGVEVGERLERQKIFFPERYAPLTNAVGAVAPS